MAAIIPISCKSGVVIFSSNHLYGEEWGANLEIENEDYKHFELTADANNLVWKQVLTSFSGGTGSVRMKYDNTVGARPMPNKNIWLDQTGTGWLGYTSLIGLIITYTIIGVKPASNTNTPGSTMFDFDFKITACTFSITGP